MHLLYCDESNLEERPGDFLLYGGLAIDAARSLDLSETIGGIRRDAGIDRSYQLKFSPAPENLSHQEFIDVKQSVIQAAIEHGAKLLSYIVLHDIAKNPDKARRNGINTICYHFDCLLHRVGPPGLVLIDRFNDKGNKIDAHLKEKFSIGVTGMPYSSEMRLNKIVGFHYSTIGQSHFPSLIDVIIGSFRFAINAHTHQNEGHMNTAHKILKTIAPLFFRETEEEPVSEIGLLFSPKTVKSDKYREQYQALKEFLEQAGIETAQPITAEHRL